MVPNNRADLLQMLAYTKPKANIKGNKKGYKAADNNSYLSVLDYAYWCLFANCISLAQVSFSNDPAFKQFFDYYEREIENSKKGFFAKLFGK